MKTAPEIARLTVADAGEVSRMLKGASAEYAVHFHPFGFEEAAVTKELSGARKDGYWGMRVGGRMAGIYMLRGFDAGYERPSFGVFVAEEFAGRGLATRALAEATRWCEENGVREMMLSVYAENTVAVGIYEEAGFAATGRTARQIVMTKKVGR